MPLALDVLVDPGLNVAGISNLQSLATFAAERVADMPTGDWSMTLRIVDDGAISRLHATYFSDPSPTDVISFPSGDDFSFESGHLGDIVISLDTAAEQAEDASHSIEREVAFLLLHGLLHLTGHVDATTDERQAMLALQGRLLDAFDAQCGSTW